MSSFSVKSSNKYFGTKLPEPTSKNDLSFSKEKFTQAQFQAQTPRFTGTTDNTYVGNIPSARGAAMRQTAGVMADYC